MTTTQILEALSHLSTTEDCKALVQANNSSTVEQIFKDCYDKSIKFNVKKVLVAKLGIKTLDEAYDSFHEILMKCAQRQITGQSAVDAVSSCIEQFDASSQKVLLNILDRNLRCGVGLKQYSEWTGTKVEAYSVPLAKHLRDQKTGKMLPGVNPTDGSYYASHKLDGLRCQAWVDLAKQSVVFKRRSGKDFTSLAALTQPVLNLFKGKSGKWVLDGECCVIKDGVEDFQAILHEYNIKDHQVEHPKYCVFDCVSQDCWNGLTAGLLFHDRYQNMKTNLNWADPEHLELLEQELVTSQAIYDKWYQRVIDNNWEGFMLRKDAYFKLGRSKDLCKVKPYMDAEFTVEGIIEGKQTTSLPGQGMVEYEGVKDLVIRFQGDEVHVGGGLSRQQRIDWLKDPTQIVGKVITVKYLEETTDLSGKHSLRHPTLKCVYSGKRED